MDLPGRIARLVGAEMARKPGDLLGRAEPAHGLAVDEGLAHRLKALARSLGLVGDALVEGWRLDRAGADRIGADAALDVVGRDRLRQPDHRRLGGAVGVAVRNAAHRAGA